MSSVVGKLSLLLLLSMRNVCRNPRRTWLTVVAIGVGVGSALALAALARGMSLNLVENAVQSFTGHISVHAQGFFEDPVIQNSMQDPFQDLESILEGDHVRAWTRRIRVPAVIKSERESFGVTLLGVDFEEEQSVTFLKDAKIERSSSGEVDPTAGVLIGRKLAEKLGVKLRRRIVLLSEGVGGKIRDRGMRVAGIYQGITDGVEMNFVLVARESIEKFLGLSSHISEISILLKDRSLVEELKFEISQTASRLEVLSWQDKEPLVATILKLQDGMLLFWFGIVVIAISFGLVNSLYMAIFERRRELRLMLALGLKPTALFGQIVMESGLLLLSGLVLGNAIGFSLVLYFGAGIDLAQFSEATEMLGASRILVPVVLSRDLFWLNGIVMVLGIAAGVLPALRAFSYDRLGPSIGGGD